LELDKAFLEIKNPERVAILNKIKTGKDNYDNTFNNAVVKNQRKRNKAVTEPLNTKGPRIETHLTKIMQSANSDGDIQAAFLAGTAVRNYYWAGFMSQNF
jgi:methyl-accepting chemotaxis protein